jgi:hypothetical protein
MDGPMAFTTRDGDMSHAGQTGNCYVVKRSTRAGGSGKTGKSNLPLSPRQKDNALQNRPDRGGQVSFWWRDHDIPLT